METVLASLAGNMASNATSEWHASKQMQREQRLMDIQNDMNNANVLNAYSQQVQGLRMAGLSPALLNGQTPNVASPVSKGSVSQAENVELDPSIALMQATADKTREETRALENTNDQTDAANDAMTQGLIQDFNTEIDDLQKNLAKVKPDTEEYNKIEGRIKNVQAMRDKLSDGSYRGALGILKGTEAARANARERANILTEYLNGKIDRSVAAKKVDNGTIDSLSKMPNLNKEKLSQDIEHVKQLIAESESKEELNDQTVLKLQKDIEEIGDNILRAHLNDENYVRFMAENAPTEELRNLYKKSILGNLTDTEFRKWKYELGKNVITGAATGGAIGAAGGAIGSVGKWSKGKNGMDKFDQYMEGYNKVRRAKESVGKFSTPKESPLRSSHGYEFHENDVDASGIQQMRKY